MSSSTGNHRVQYILESLGSRVSSPGLHPQDYDHNFSVSGITHHIFPLAR